MATEYNGHSIYDVIGEGAEVIADQGDEVLVRWEDGSEGWLYYKEHYGWVFPNENCSYEAGFAYAAGYRD